MNDIRFLHIFTFAVVMLGWIIFASIFLLRKGPPREAKEQKRVRAALLGIAIQGVAYAIVWSKRRPFSTPFLTSNLFLEAILGLLAVGLVVGSLWMVLVAVRTLGKQWSVAARLVEEHELITEGPYKLVRHPIYTGMFGMLLATGLAVTYWQRLLVAALIFATGTWIRVYLEEKLLRAQFGPAYESYARRVPAVLPWKRRI
jgi:protein-S-isoprenylcysteine O-methyltransferase Ste14